jgi:molybdopterin converting factor small subunit
MVVHVQFYSYFKDLTGCAETVEELPDGSTTEMLLGRLYGRFPTLVPMAKSMLVAVGVEYADRHQVLRDRDEVSLFPPVQGG